MTDPMAPYANETPEQTAERERQQAEQAALEAGERNNPAQVVEEIPVAEETEAQRTARSTKK